MTGGSRTSRAAVELADAPSSPCPHCGRTTKTVQGVCADCWGVKDPDVAIDLRPPPRTEPLLGLDDFDLFDLGPILVVAALALAAGAVLALVFGLR